MIHALTIDVEDYHSVTARDWQHRDMAPTEAVVRNTRRILGWLADRSARATFFVLGEVAETFPDLIRDIALGGHELGVHGYYHRQVFKLDRASFGKEVRDAKRVIENAVQAAVRGHRAPAFSIMPQTRWALDVLAEAGFAYDSSIFPIRGRRYGWPGFRRDIHALELGDGRRLIEAPMSTVRLFGRSWPSCGGGYLRHFPVFVTRWAIRRVQRRRPAIVYMHPYEIELNPPPLDVSMLDRRAAARLRRVHRLQLRNRGTMERKIHTLLDEFEFAPLGEVIETELARNAG